MTNTLAINIENLRFRWPKQSDEVLRIAQFKVKTGEHLFIQGASGSGKSTFLNLISGVLSPQSGSIELLGTQITALSSGKKDHFRADHLGIVFQQFNLLPYLTAIQNVELALNTSKKKTRRVKQSGQPNHEIMKLLSSLGLDDRVVRKQANQLSIGQQQRVAVARALIGQPEILIADEPTSALDSDSRDQFMTALFQAAEQANTTIIFVSHDPGLQRHFQRHINLTDINLAITEGTS